jgi:leucyl-tRNA synthetase
MSKSRGNVINPDDILKEYGADAFRLYEMFLGPLEMTKPWNTRGVEGVYRFLGRVWRLFVDESSETEFEQAAPPIPTADANTSNASAAPGHQPNPTGPRPTPRSTPASRKSPKTSITSASTPPSPPSWCSSTRPSPGPELLAENTLELPVQVNGKLRDKIRVPVHTPAAEIEQTALTTPRIQTFIAGKTVRKIILVPGKLVNIVVA